MATEIREIKKTGAHVDLVEQQQMGEPHGRAVGNNNNLISKIASPAPHTHIYLWQIVTDNLV